MGPRRASLALGVAVLALPSFAAEVDFRPVLLFGLYHDGNVRIVGSNAVGSDSATAVADLPVTRTTPNATFTFLYRARYVWYWQNSNLNYLGNTIATSYSSQLSRRSNLRATLDVSRTQAQGVVASGTDRPFTFVPRTNITRAYAIVGGSVGVARRSLVDWEVHGGADSYEAVPGVPFNNSTTFGVRGGWRAELSERTTLGVAANIDWFGYAVGDDYIAETVILTGTHQVGRYTDMTFDVGATRTTTAGDSSNDLRLLLSFSRQLTELSQLRGGVAQAVTSGTGLQAATNDTGAWVSYAQSSRRGGFTGALDGAYWIRKSISVGGAVPSDSRTLNLTGALGWNFNRFVSLGAACAYVEQTEQNDSASALNTRYASYGLFLRWAIRGAEARGFHARFRARN